jgi:hypothetical protein
MHITMDIIVESLLLIPDILNEVIKMKQNKFIPYKKLSKRKKRELDKSKRVVWTFNPVTRKESRGYTRSKNKKVDLYD